MPTRLLIPVLVFFQVETLAYLAVNGVASRMRSVPLLTPADAVVPARPSSLWLYLSFVPYCLLAAFECRGLRRLGRVLACVALEALVSYRCFLKFPSSYPRPPVGEAGRLGAAWRALHRADRPANTFPSVHVGHAFLLALALAHHLPRQRADALLLWATLIAASTLTTKQHYVVDLAGGVLAAEAVVTHVYEPWEEGRLSWRQARRELGALCERLDALAQDPAGARLPAAERHPCLRAFLAGLAAQPGLAEAYLAASGRGHLLGQGRRLARRLGRVGPVLRALTGLLPGWLQFAALLQEEAPALSDGRLAAYLREEAVDLRRGLDLLFEPEPAAPPHQP